MSRAHPYDTLFDVLFNSFDFLIFWVVLFGIYWSIPKRYQNKLLLFGSFLFYGYWDWRFLGLLILVVLLSFFVALVYRGKKTSRIFLATGVAGNLAVLGVFKYFDFFVRELQSLLPFLSIEGSVLGYFVLPLGVSFYTLQSISYIVDVYRERIRPCRSLLDFALFVCFFPQLLAGPIERAHQFLPQVQNNRLWRSSMFVDGILLALWGFFQKTVIADNLMGSMSLTFSNPQVISTPAIYMATLGASIRLYCDFSGYSKIARGVAMTLGFELTTNFYNPFFAKSPQEFWRRWHITLTTWFRDYVLRPLHRYMKYRLGFSSYFFATLVTTGLIGLWHGPSGHFIVWGVAQGLIVSIAYKVQRIWRPQSRRVNFVLWFVYFQAILFSGQFFFVNKMTDMAIHGQSWVAGFEFGDLEASLLLQLVFFGFPLFLFEAFHEVKKMPYFLANARARPRIIFAYLVYVFICLSAVPGMYLYDYLQF